MVLQESSPVLTLWPQGGDWVLGLRGTAQQLPGLGPAVPHGPALPGVGQGGLQQAAFSVLPMGAAAGAPHLQKALEAV